MLLVHSGIVAAASTALVLTTPSYVSNGGIVGNGTTASTAVSIPYPASGLQANDIAILSLSGDNHSTMAVPGDWTPCGAQFDGTFSVSGRVWWKRLAGTESGSVACTRGTGATNEWFGGVISVFRNCQETGTPFEGYATAEGTSVTENAPAVTTTGDKRLAVLVWCQGDDGVSTPPAGYTEQFDLVESSGNDGGHALDTQVVPTAATIAAVTRTIPVAAPSTNFGFALLPKSGAAPTFGPITRTHLGQAVGTTTAAVSVTATAGALLVVSVGVRKNTVATNAVTCADNAGVGNTYTDVVAQGNQLGTNGVRLAKLKCRLSAGGTFTITASSASATSMGIEVEQFVDASDDLSNVSPMVYNANADPACTLPNTPSAANIVLGSYVSTGSSPATNPSGYTSINTQAPTGATVQTCFNNTTTAAASWAGPSVDGIACLLEVKQAV